MIILGIETSCDETATAILENGTKVLSFQVASSEEIHKKYGGIVPEQAAREQIKYIIPVIKEAIKKSKISIKNIDALAVTYGPGLVGSLIIGIETAKTLSFIFKKPIVPVNHLTAHLYGNFINQKDSNKKSQSKIQFPALGLIVSGGHTELILMKKHGQYKWIGGTRDDAAGECFDKCARLLGFAYPGGPEIEKIAANFNLDNIKNQSSYIKLPRPMINDKSFDFSFSGLKTALMYKLKTIGQKHKKSLKTQLAYELQEAITDILVTKTLKAGQLFNVKSILVGGGVTANLCLRNKLKNSLSHLSPQVKLFIPDIKWCTDNGVTIAAAAYFNYKPLPLSQIKPNPSLEIC
ncbi:tRNA (adenosine(37)-N6)-threonylcarbamoyltransferase complex transferase subunit TsaD [Patescibacteria group bacterium]